MLLEHGKKHLEIKIFMEIYHIHFLALPVSDLGEIP